MSANFSDLDLNSVDGYKSVVLLGSESLLLASDGDGSKAEPNRSTQTRRLGKRNRQRLQRRLSGIALGTVDEEPTKGSSGTPKQPRIVTGTTPEAAAKKMRTYAQTVAESSVKKFCVRDNNPNIILDEEKLDLFRSEISRRVLDSVRSTGFVPQMLGCYLFDGVFVCKSASIDTYNWFCEQVSNINNIWSGCQLAVGDSPKPLLLQVWIPGKPDDPCIVRTNIGLMNPNLSTKGWKVVRCKREAYRQSIVFRVDRKSFESISGSNLLLQYVLEKISFKIISGT